jgi:hypothetical protein
MAASMKMTDFLDIAPCSIVEANRRFRGAFASMMIEAVRTSETSVYFKETTRHSQKAVIFGIDMC